MEFSGSLTEGLSFFPKNPRGAKKDQSMSYKYNEFGKAIFTMEKNQHFKYL